MTDEADSSYGVFGEWAADHTVAFPTDATITPRMLTDAATAKTQVQPGTDPADVTAARALPSLNVITDAAADGDLELLDVLGEGGMGIVRSARQRSLDREVAVKTLRAEVGGTETVAALLAEARVAGGLDHPNVVPVYALGRDSDGRPALVLKRVEGETWTTLLRQPEHPFWGESRRWSSDPLERNLTILLEVCDAVEYAHARGVLHRDLKPDNVMVGRFGEVYVMDWGLAVRAEEGGPYPPGGTLCYMAPEMLDGEADRRSDVYLLGSILHEILTGEHRHRGPTRMRVLSSIFRSAPCEYDASVPAELGAVANRATRFAPADRFDDVASFREAIADYLAHRGSLALCDAAEEHLEALEAASRLEPADAPAVTRAAAAARFGFTLAQRDWPENEAARAGLRRCVELQTRWEAEHGGPRAAQRLLDELRELGCDEAALAPLAERVAARLAEHERREELAAALDPRVSAVERRRLFLTVTAILFVFMLVLMGAIFGGGFEPSQAVLVGAPMLGLLGFGVLVVATRGILWRNEFNQRVAFSLAAFIGGVVLHRVVASFAGLSVPMIITTDMALGASMAALAGAAFGQRWLLLLAAIGASGAIVATLTTNPFLVAGPVAGLAAVIVASVLWRARHR